MRLRTLALSVLFLGLTGLPASALAKKLHPCSHIAKACKKEGYSIGGIRSSGQGLMRDCLAKVVAGQSLPGIQVNFDVVGACRSRFQARQTASLSEERRPKRAQNRRLDGKSRDKVRRESTGFSEAPALANPAAATSSSGRH